MVDTGLDVHGQKDASEPAVLPGYVNNFQEPNSHRVADKRKGTRSFQRATLEMSNNINSKRVPLRRCGRRDRTTITELEKLDNALQNTNERPKDDYDTSNGVMQAGDKTHVSNSIKRKITNRTSSRMDHIAPPELVNEVSVNSKSVKREPMKKAAKQKAMSWDVLNKLVGFKYKYLSGILYSTQVFTRQLDHV